MSSTTKSGMEAGEQKWAAAAAAVWDLPLPAL